MVDIYRKAESSPDEDTAHIATVERIEIIRRDECGRYLGRYIVEQGKAYSVVDGKICHLPT